MEYAEAVKKVRAVKPRENKMIVVFGYDTKLVINHSDGIALMNALANAELLDDGYGKPHRINPIDRNKVTVNPLSSDEYDQYKIAALLNISLDEVKEFALKAEG